MSTIGSISPGAMAQLEDQVATRVAKITLDAQKQQGEMVVEMIEEVIDIAGLVSASGQPTMPHLGGQIDVKG